MPSIKVEGLTAVNVLDGIAGQNNRAIIKVMGGVGIFSLSPPTQGASSPGISYISGEILIISDIDDTEELWCRTYEGKSCMLVIEDRTPIP